MNKVIYLDNAAATPIDRRVSDAIHRASRVFGNPSSPHRIGRAADEALRGARDSVAKFLHARRDEVVFCGSGSEANTLAILGVLRGASGRGGVVTTPIEHASVLAAAQRAKLGGHSVVYAPVDRYGLVSVEDVLRACTKHTRIISIAYANNEIGSVQPISKIARAVAGLRRSRGSSYPVLHVDACQATEYLDMDVQRLGVDLLTLNGAKAHGPHGVAILYVRRGVVLEPLILGGSQELGMRAGTEDVVGAIGLAKALSLVRASDAVRVCKLRDYCIKEIQRIAPDAVVSGALGDGRVANNIHISFPRTDSENLVLEFDRRGICVGSGSACTAHSTEPSHVLRAIQTPEEVVHGAVRASLSRETTKKDLQVFLKELPSVVARVRARRV